MTDKQIIIDYKNLCENYSKEVGCYNTFDGSCIKEQCFTYRLLQLLQAKEQECEQIKEKYEALKLENQEGYEIVAELKHEYEGLKKQLETAEEWRIKAESLNEKLELKNTCYRKALEEIEKYCTYMNTFNKYNKTNKGLNIDEVLKIISKAKDGE